MDTAIIFFIILFVVCVLGGGGAYLLFIKTRPKKQYWAAKVYQLRGGIIPPKKDKKGNVLGVETRDLVPYIEDTIEKRTEDQGKETYVLSRLDKTICAVNAQDVEVWGQKKIVNVLLDGDTATIMGFGYDETTGKKLFRPMPRERIDMIKSEILLKKNRLVKKKDLLMALAPYVILGISFFALIGIFYLSVNSTVKIAEEGKDAQKYQSDKQVESAEIWREGIRELSKTIDERIENKVNALGPQNTTK